MKERNIRLFGKANSKEIWYKEVQDPAGNWLPIFEGRKFIVTTDGAVFRTPDDPLFRSETEAQDWLNRAEKV